MFDRFTDRSRRVLVLAQEDARNFGHGYIGTEHLLLGLIHEEDGVAAKALRAVGITFDEVRDKLRDVSGPQVNPSPSSPQFTLRAKKVLELSLREASQLGHSYVGTEHLLLGLVREGSGVAIQILTDLGVEKSLVRAQVFQLISGRSFAERVEPLARIEFDGAVFRGMVRAVGERLRPDLDAIALDVQSVQIADDLLNQLRKDWGQPDSSP